MPSEIDFLRTKWPKLAAIGAEAERLIPITPAGAIECMQSFCSWAADICLELVDIPMESVATDAEKIDALYASGMIPAEVVEKFRIIFSAGSNARYRVTITENEAVACYNHLLDIGRWMKREADTERPAYLEQRPGPPYELSSEPARRTHAFTPPTPANGLDEQSAAPRMRTSRRSVEMPADMTPAERPAQKLSDPFPYAPGKQSSGGFVEFFEQYRQYFYIGLAALAVVVVGVIIALIIRGAVNRNSGALVLPTVTPAAVVTATPEPIPTPTPEPVEVTKALSALEPVDEVKYLARDKWEFRTLSGDFNMNGTVYNTGVGMFVASGAIRESRGSQSIIYQLDGKYSLLRFDLGCDDQMAGYSADYGKFRLQIYADDETDPRYTSDFQKFDFFAEDIEVDVSNATRIKIVLTEEKGSKGTLNVIMGNAQLVEAQPAAPAATPAPTLAPETSPTPEA